MSAAGGESRRIIIYIGTIIREIIYSNVFVRIYMQCIDPNNLSFYGRYFFLVRMYTYRYLLVLGSVTFITINNGHYIFNYLYGHNTYHIIIVQLSRPVVKQLLT